MNYVCLAAGKGSRMDDLGTYLQKCMYPVYGIPFLRFSLDNLIDSQTFTKGEDRITIVTGHLGEQIPAYFGTSYRGQELCYVEQKKQRGTADAVYTAARAGSFGEVFVVWLADTYVPSALFDAVRMAEQDTALSIARHRCKEKHNERVDIDEEKKLISRAWKGSGDYVEIGVWKLHPTLLEKLFSRKADEYRFLPAVQAAIEEGSLVSAVPADEWLHLGGTEPSVRENLIHVTQRLLAELRL